MRTIRFTCTNTTYLHNIIYTYVVYHLYTYIGTDVLYCTHRVREIYRARGKKPPHPVYPSHHCGVFKEMHAYTLRVVDSNETIYFNPFSPPRCIIKFRLEFKFLYNTGTSQYYYNIIYIIYNR